MATEAGFYLEQAVICGNAADAAMLPNLRDKYLRSQAAWQALADREARVRAERAQRDADKAVALPDPTQSETVPFLLA